MRLLGSLAGLVLLLAACGGGGSSKPEDAAKRVMKAAFELDLGTVWDHLTPEMQQEISRDAMVNCDVDPSDATKARIEVTSVEEREETFDGEPVEAREVYLEATLEDGETVSTSFTMLLINGSWRTYVGNSLLHHCGADL